MARLEHVDGSPRVELELPGAAIVAALRQHVEQPTIVAVHSAPRDSVSAVHLLGGIDRASGKLVGFALHRVWS